MRRWHHAPRKRKRGKRWREHDRERERERERVGGGGGGNESGKAAVEEEESWWKEEDDEEEEGRYLGIELVGGVALLRRLDHEVDENLTRHIGTKTNGDEL